MIRFPGRWIVLLTIALGGGAPGTAAAGQPMPAHASFTIDSAVLKEVRHLNVYTPPGYDVAKDTHYPVLYMPDGGLQEDFPHVAGDIDAAIRAGAMRPMIVVGIENTERRRDMTGPDHGRQRSQDRPARGWLGRVPRVHRGRTDAAGAPALPREWRDRDRRRIAGRVVRGRDISSNSPGCSTPISRSAPACGGTTWHWHAAPRHDLQAQPGLAVTLYVASAGDDGLDETGGGLLHAALRDHAPRGLRWFYQPWPQLQHATIYREASPAVFRQLFAPR